MPRLHTHESFVHQAHNFPSVNLTQKSSFHASYFQTEIRLSYNDHI